MFVKTRMLDKVGYHVSPVITALFGAISSLVFIPLHYCHYVINYIDL